MTSDPKLYGLCHKAGRQVDDLLLDLAATLTADGHRLAGFVQKNATTSDGEANGILLHNLKTGQIHDVSDRRGSGASGCNLDWGALADLAGWLERQLQLDVPSLVVINRFGKAELEGRGFCAVIEICLERGVPILVAYRSVYAASWAHYHGGYAREISGQSQGDVISELGLPVARKVAP